MVYAYPSNATFKARKIKRTRKLTAEEKAIKDFYDSHDISIVKDESTGKLVAKVINK